MQPKSINKSFSSIKLAIDEEAGYEFFTKFYSNIPILYGRSDATLFYENRLLKGVSSVSDALYNKQSFTIETTLRQYALNCKAHGRLRQSEGGTQLFYLNRLIRLSSMLESEFKNWVQKHPSVMFGNIYVKPSNSLVSDLRDEVNRFKRGLCVPSQGDFHERNILTCGTILDFEAAGWNLLATDLATFIWHTLFAGSYFGLKYAKWSTKKDLGLVQDVKPMLNSSGKLVFPLPRNRKVLLNDYLETVYKRLPINIEIEQDIRSAIAFRLLTTFPVMGMSESDRAISFALANLVFDNNYSFSELLNTFLSE